MIADNKTSFGDKIRANLNALEKFTQPLVQLRAFTKKSKTRLSKLGCEIADLLLKQGLGHQYVCDFLEMNWIEVEESLREHRGATPSQDSHLEQAKISLNLAADQIASSSLQEKQLQHTQILGAFQAARNLMDSCIRHDIEAGVTDALIAKMYRIPKKRISDIRAEMKKNFRKTA